MRTIKFRAWNGEEMRQVFCNEIQSCFDEEFNVQDGYSVMQFTGLLDKNGKEIYENDVIKRKGAEWWDNKEDTQIIVDDITALPTQCGDWSVDIEDYEIIGNIYENSDLLSNK